MSFVNARATLKSVQRRDRRVRAEGEDIRAGEDIAITAVAGDWWWLRMGSRRGWERGGVGGSGPWGDEEFLLAAGTPSAR